MHKNKQIVIDGITYYRDCDTIKKTKPILEVGQEIVEALGQDYRVLPIYEGKIFRYAYKRYYSLETNEYLNCRWEEFKRHAATHVTVPFEFPQQKDFHFHNQLMKHKQSETISRRSNFKNHMKQGPMVDLYGQVPVSQETFMNRDRLPGNDSKRPSKFFENRTTGDGKCYRGKRMQM